MVLMCISLIMSELDTFSEVWEKVFFRDDLFNIFFNPFFNWFTGPFLIGFRNNIIFILFV